MRSFGPLLPCRRELDGFEVMTKSPQLNGGFPRATFVALPAVSLPRGPEAPAVDIFVSVFE